MVSGDANVVRNVLRVHNAVMQWTDDSFLTPTTFAAEYRFLLIFRSKLTHPAARSLYDSLATC